ncbi:MAG TPA: alkaline phosphatase family protein [Terriglobia bacterium]|nr:alkaline phosphatase family protein [Terriglobia bacterium]
MTRTLFIGLDGATFSILDPLIGDSEGNQPTMPFLRHLIDNGVRAKLLSTPNPLTPQAWVSLMTGRMPGHHGVFDFLHAEEKDDEVYFTLSDARNIRTETLWSIASRQDRRVISLNLPITAPPRPVNGAIVPGFVPWKHLRRNVTPVELFERLKSVPGFDAKRLAWDFEKESQVMEEFTQEQLEDWVRYHVGREEQWARISEKLLVEDEPDLMAVMFDGMDKIQHQAWPFLDPLLLATQSSPSTRRIVDLCREYFRNVDRYIERLVTLAGPQAQVFLASDHGFTSSTHAVRINTLLHDLGYLRWRLANDSDPERRREQSWFANLDWKRTVAYCRTPSSNGITIRVAQAPGATGISPPEYESFRDHLIAQLREVRDEETGEPIFQQIHKREEVFRGQAMKDAPDLLMVCRDHGFMSIRNARPIIEKRKLPIGTHHPDGIFVAFGNGIVKGLTIERRRIVDTTSILLYSLGLPVPNDLEGEVPQHIFSDDHLARNPVRIGPSTYSVEGSEVRGGEITDKEKQKIIDQLRMLGYME